MGSPTTTEFHHPTAGGEYTTRGIERCIDTALGLGRQSTDEITRDWAGVPAPVILSCLRTLERGGFIRQYRGKWERTSKTGNWWGGRTQAA